LLPKATFLFNPLEKSLAICGGVKKTRCSQKVKKPHQNLLTGFTHRLFYGIGKSYANHLIYLYKEWWEKREKH